MKDGADPDYAALWRGIQADRDLILGDALADAEADRNIRKFEASRRRRRAIRKAVRLVVIVAVLLAAVCVFAAAAS